MPNIFLLQEGNALVEMAQQPYESEYLLQRLLETHPSVLAGDQFNGPEPKRWLLIRRETGVPAEDAGADRWSLDHLFVDQHGVPTLVEVKRSSDTRIRREVIGQMFDYAANAMVYWPAGRIRSLFEAEANRSSAEPSADERIADFLRLNSNGQDDNRAIDQFWNTVETNLRAGKIRMVFVADAVPPELRRIVEFLNVQMNPAEILAIEIKQFTGSGVTTLVPTVIGQTAQAEARRRASTGAKRWDLSSFLDALRANRGEPTCEVVQEIFQWSDKVLPAIYWGEGSQKGGSCYRGLIRNPRNLYLFAIWTTGKVEVSFRNLKRYTPPVSESARLELLNRLNKIPDIKLGEELISGCPKFDLEMVLEPATRAKFYDAMQWAAGQIEKGTFAPNDR